MKTIVENLNELIDIKGGETHGATIAQCLSILNEIETASASESEGLSEEEDGGKVTEPETELETEPENEEV